MRILLVHNFYGSESPSGENQVFEAEKDMLRRRGHEISTFVRYSDSIRKRGFIGMAQGALSTPWNPFAAQQIDKVVSKFRPDVVHAHNTFPLISPAIFSKIGDRAAVVLTLHNYRLFCPAAIPMREGAVCTECLDSRSSAPALLHGCYRGSRVATLPLAAGVSLHRRLKTWDRHIDAFIALSSFQAERMTASGLPAALSHVKPNFFPGNPKPIPWNQRGNFFVFVGRLSEEKGVRTLINTWAEWGANAPELRIIGDGPLRSELESLAKGLSVRFFGQLPEAAAQLEIASASMLVLPSECFEGFPMVVREAFAFGTPVAVSNLGPLPSIVQSSENGVLFEAGNSSAQLQVLRQIWGSPLALEQLGQGARQSFESLYTEEANYEQLVKIYQNAILAKQRNTK